MGTHSVQVFSLALISKALLGNLLFIQTQETLPTRRRQLWVILAGHTMGTQALHVEKSFTAACSRNMDKTCGCSPHVGHLDGSCHTQVLFLSVTLCGVLNICCSIFGIFCKFPHMSYNSTFPLAGCSL